MGELTNEEFAFGHISFEVPLRHPSQGAENAAGFTRLELTGLDGELQLGNQHIGSTESLETGQADKGSG